MNRTLRANRKRLVGVVAAVTVGATALTACANRPTTEDLGQAILDASELDASIPLTAGEADCIAQYLIDSDLSDTTLSGLVDNFNAPEVLAAEADDVTPTVAAAAEACVGQG
jgi:predicted small secreted protein